MLTVVSILNLSYSYNLEVIKLLLCIYKFPYGGSLKKFINWRLIFRENWSYHEKRIKKGNYHYSLRNNTEERISLLLRVGSLKSRPFRYGVTSLLLKPLKQRLFDVSSFRLSNSLYSRSVLFVSTSSFGSVFLNCLDCTIDETKFSTRQLFLFSSYFSNHFNLSYDAQNCTVAMLSLYQFPVWFRSGKVERRFMHKVSNRYYFHLPGRELVSLPDRVWRLVF
jgi:hypothetical protein